MARLVFGCGYLGLRVARRWRDAGQTVFAVTRSKQRGEELRAQGLVPVIADVTEPATFSRLPPADSVLFAVGFDRRSGQSVRQVYVTGLRSVLDALPSSVHRLIYISSTGVFGQMDGVWVDEDSVCRPIRPTGKACLDAEQLLARHALGARSIILRLAGIYGPGRLPWSKGLLQGTPIVAGEHGHLNLIHVEDAARAILAAERSAVAPCTYLVSDGSPVPRGEYCRLLARLLQAPAAHFESPSPDSPTARRALTDKRVNNGRMRRDLKVALAYPTYREGLAAILKTNPVV